MDKRDPTDQLVLLEKKATHQRGLEARARAKAEKHERRIAALRLSHGLAAPKAEPATPALAPLSGVAAIRALLREDPSRVWSAGEVHAELEQRTWVSRSARHRLQGTEAAVSRLVRRGELVRVRRGRYAVKPPRSSDTPRAGLDFQTLSADTPSK